MEAQDLSGEDPSADEDAGHEAQKAPEVFGSDFSQVHGHHTQRDTCRWSIPLITGALETATDGLHLNSAVTGTVG